jgi:glyoxylase-like metal-dependent hydrolase (beta-lactamase superfamily II)
MRLKLLLKELILLSISLLTLIGFELPCTAQTSLIAVKLVPNLYMWTDICNVYVLRDGDKAILIDLGDGSVISHLSEIGVKQVDWVLFTHHHREQCQGYPLLKSVNTKIAAPKAEKSFFEQPASFRKMKTSLDDPFTVYGASYVRPPVQSIPVDREFSRMDTFTWQGYELSCIETPGNSPGSMSYLLKKEGKWIAFSGDVILDGAKMHNFFDSEWDYGFGAGFRALYNSAALLRDFHPVILLPSHGNIILNPETELKTYIGKLFNLERLVLRGYDVLTYSSASQDMVSKPTDIPFLWQVSPHLFKYKGPEYFPNFSLILSENGHALLVDCGLIDTAFLGQTLGSMKLKYGLKQIDALIVTHVHGDHFLQAPYIRQKWGTQVWALENMVPVMEHPEKYDLAALIPAYHAGFDSIHVDRAFKPGETFSWEEYKFIIDWMPGQTEYALCMNGIIDGRKVAFTGDNIFGDPTNTLQSGHEALVARNSAIPEEGYIYAAEYLTRLKPDILIGGHSYVMDKPEAMISRYRTWAYEMRKAFQEISNEADYRDWFDPYRVHAEPYRTEIRQGGTAEFNLVVRNFSENTGKYRIEMHTASGIAAEPAFLEVNIDGKSSRSFPVRLAASADQAEGISIVAFDLTVNGKRYGEWFDTLISIENR